MSPTKGISEAAARQRLLRDGYNELPTSKRRSLLSHLIDVLREPMVALLVGCGIIYLILGDSQEALMLLGFLGIIVFITIYQEQKTETALLALRNLSSPRALVLRDGIRKRIPGREVVCGDLLVLSEGDRIPADAQLLKESNLQTDESLLTGESVAVRKSLPSRVYAGTTVVGGQALAEVMAIGMNTEIGKIGRMLETAKPEITRLTIETRKLVKFLSLIATALCVLVIVVYGLTRNNWLGGFLSGLTLAMAILPNELPAVLMIFLALGAWRISGRHVLTRNMPAVENLGSATVLCVDKTGTLTMNQMAVSKIYVAAPGQDRELTYQAGEILDETFHELVEYGILASSPTPFDPMEKAVHRVGGVYLYQTEHLHPDWSLAQEYPLTPELMAVSQAWQGEPGGGYVVGAKGAPEAIIDLCHLGIEEAKRINNKVEQFGRTGLRVIGVAKASLKASSLPGNQHDYDFSFLGLLGLSDPLRPGVSQSVRECYEAGIRVIMITGDHAHTASSVAHRMGLHNPEDVITGPELAVMDDTQLGLRLKAVNCFARMVPEQKLRLVEALKKNGEVVAMTGDGVNDAPALKAAHIGIAMGGRGSDVARESASLVLLDDDFSSIVAAICMGRRIFDNLRSAMAYLLAIHIPIAGISVLPVLLKLPLVLLPVHVAFLHLIIEPACSFVFEAEPAQPRVMKRKPRLIAAPLFSRDLLIPSLIQGMVVFAIVVGVFLVSLYRGQDEAEARALTFTTLIFANLGLILVNRSWSLGVVEGLKVSNKALWWVILGALTTLITVLYVPPVRTLFQFAFLHPVDIVVCIGAGLISIIWFEGWKWFTKV